MSDLRSNGSYSYDGRLVFNGLYSTEILDPDFDLETTVEEGLKDFARGTNEEPGSGYHMLDFTERISESPDISRQIKSEMEGIHGIRYQYEEWNEREVESMNGDGTEYRNVRTTDSVDVYWDSPNYLFIKGNKTEARQAGSLIESKLGDYIRTREIGFASDFLLWILSQYKNGEQLGEELSAKLLSNARIEGEEDRFGRSNRVDDSTDIAKATTILMGILRGKEMAFVEGIFGMHGKFVTAKIETGGRIHIKAEQDIEGSSHLERMALSVCFLKELLAVYDYWQSLPSEDKYPPVEFFQNLYEECERQGAEVTFPVDEVIRRYREKGNREEYKERQSGIAEFQ